MTIIDSKYFVIRVVFLGGVLGVSVGVQGVLHLTSLYNANWLFTSLIIQK